MSEGDESVDLLAAGVPVGFEWGEPPPGQPTAKQRCAPFCQGNGQCVLRGTECVPGAEEDCLRSTYCESTRPGERCYRAGDACSKEVLSPTDYRPASPEGCRDSAVCSFYGACHFVAGRCAIQSEEDCQKAQICRDSFYQRCRFENGDCIK
ncbi:MAG: hypothetical protein HY744_11870 [Deltaproteobacteria bacterium]|nr:hypothetical protein [Deltaproteobacteria bacterium]